MRQQRKPGSWDERAWWAKQLGRRADDPDVPGEEPSATPESEELAEELVAALDGAQAVVDALLAEIDRGQGPAAALRASEGQ